MTQPPNPTQTPTRPHGIGTAPVSFRVYDAANPLPAAEMAAAAARIGYAGTELGPAGWFGRPHEAAETLGSNGLSAIGAYAAVHVTGDDTQVERDLAAMERSCAELVACGGGTVVLADAGTPDLARNPARAPDDTALALDAAGWERLAAVVERAARRVRDAGLNPSFHPHLCTHVESAGEVERLLDLVDVGLTLDTGHLRLAGADPVECLRAWRERIDHVHVKDVDLAALERVKAAGRTDHPAWWGDLFRPLGGGDADLARFVRELAAGGYRGWWVVEHDGPTTGGPDLVGDTAVQTANLAWLRRLLSPANPT
ncbi:TIM barrel protein [Actinomycetes bacterium KLBMP 9759]